jgi:hypothetical protein
MSWKDEDVAQDSWSDADVAVPVKRQPDSFMSRVKTGLMDPIVGAAQLAEKIPGLPQARKFLTGSDTSMSDVVRQRDAEYSAPEGVDWGRMAGNMANPVSWAGGGAGVGRAAAQGALQSSLAPVSPDADFATQKAMQAGIGGAGGALVSKLLRGFTPTAEAKALMDQGIQPSFGQSMGGVINKTEQKAEAIPLVGDFISHARNRPVKEFEHLVLNKVAPGAKNVEEANKYASGLYGEVVPYLRPTPEAVKNMQASVRSAMNNPELTDQGKQILFGLVEKHGQNFGQLSGEGIKKLDSELGFLARKYQAGDPASKTLADEIYNVQKGLREGLEPGLPPEMQGKLKEANRTWRELIPINKAASQRPDERITPRALQKAVARQQRTDVTRMAPDALIDNAVATLPNTVPDTGTAGRALLGGSALFGGTTLGLLPQILAAGTAAGVGSTRPVQRALIGNTAWQKALGPHDAEAIAALTAAMRTPQEQ